MDLGFFRRGQMLFAGRSPARLDYGVLVATLEAAQSSSTAARAIRRCPQEGPEPPRQDALVELLVGGPAWREALIAQGGSFSGVQAKLMRELG